MNSDEIRSRFLKFFERRGHRIVRSSSLVPANDPTLLFSNAGMNQFKDVFLGREKRDYTRACSSQKCVRAGGKHNDLEQVGRTRRHHTFFEMLGNFSFGDYFKAEAIPWAWELVTKDFAIPKEKLYATIFEGAMQPHADIPRDSEAYDLWRSVGVPAERIFELGMHDNFWQMGDTGPCGPCSEIHYDMGPEASDLGHTNCRFPCDCGRYVEIWNLVFMQFDRDEQGQLTPLPRPSIDTGAGLERIAAVLQGKLSNFDTDLFMPLIREVEEQVSAEYGKDPTLDTSFRIVADHARASTFLISDDVLPSNEGRGYVLRKIMRRGMRHILLLNPEKPLFTAVVLAVRNLMGGAYPELLGPAGAHISKVVLDEEHRFQRTVRVGLEKLEDELWEIVATLPEERGRVPDQAMTARSARAREVLRQAYIQAYLGAKVVFPGEKAFRLYDTYGLPRDLIEEVTQDTGITVDWAGFDRAMEKQRERARASWKGAEKKTAAPAYQELADKVQTVFDGYTQVKSSDCEIVALIQKGQPTTEAKAGQEIEIVLDHTPFYAESGGQVGDTGRFFAPDSDQEIAHITDTYRPVSGVTAHKATARDTLRVGDVVTAAIDNERRDAIRRNHTATHLLHAALRTTLGTHVKQAGSLVAPDRLRFDFSHYAELGEQDLLDIEDLVNQHVLKNEEVRTDLMDIDKALATGAMALFGEKYGDRVRVLSVDDGSFSRELCGGTHVRRTGDIGLFKIVNEGSVAAGTRRIEAITGLGVLEHLRKSDEALGMVGETLRAKPGEVVEAAQRLSETEKKLRKELDAQQMKRAAAQAGDLLDQARDIKGVRVVSARVEGVSRPAMRQMVDQLRARLGSGVIALGSVADGKAALIIGVTQDLTSKLDAGKIVRQAAALMEGSGGGRKDLAEAGGKNPEKLDECVQSVPGIIDKML